MVATNQCFVTPRDVARVLFRHWRKMALFFCVVAGLTLLVIALYPRSYSSEAKLFIRVGRESVALDPTATTGETIMLQKSQADEVNSALNILSSREVLKRAVEKVGAERIYRNRSDDRSAMAKNDSSSGPTSAETSTVGSWFNNLMQSLRLSDPGTENDLAIRRLEKGAKVWATKESTVITVSYVAASPELAHDVVEAITNAFLEEHLRLSHSEGSLEFFSEQAEKLHQELTAAQAELRDRMSAFQLTAGGSRRSILEKAEEALRQKLYDLELQETELKSRYTSEYPVLKEIRRQREETERRLTEMPGFRAQHVASTSASQPNSTSETPQAADKQSKLYSELETVNNQELQLSELKRNAELLEIKYRMHVEKMEQARVNEAMGREQITNVKIAQPASLVHKPVSPKKAVLLGLGLFIATVGGIGLAFLSESLDQTLRTTDQVEAHLGLPVLLSLPRRKRRRRGPAMNVASSNGHSNGVRNGHDHLVSYRGLVRELMSNGQNGAANGDRHARMVGVVGCDASKSRSQVAANLAIEAALTGSDPVLLIDADARRRRVTKRFHINGSPGWREVLAGEANAVSCIHRQETNNLSVMSPGTPNGHEPAVRPAVGVPGKLDEIKTDFGLVIVDLPPARDMDAAPQAAEWLDEMVLVVEAERTRIQTAQRAKESLNRAGVHVAGIVLANRREHIPRWLYQRL